MHISRRLRIARWEASEAVKRVGRAVRYATNRVTEDDAQQIIYECQPASGWFPLETLSVESVLTAAEERWGDNPALLPLAEQACRRVWNKWCTDGYGADAAETWALDLIEEYAEHDGVTLVDSWALPEDEEAA